jgi:hypothetical protein
VEKEVLITLDSDPTNDAGQHVSADGIPTDQPTHRILKTIKKLMIDVICAQHNPVSYIYISILALLISFPRSPLSRRSEKEKRTTSSRPCPHYLRIVVLGSNHRQVFLNAPY